MRQHVKSFLPPVLLQGLRRVRRLWVPPPYEVSANGWKAQERGWNAPGVAALERSRWPEYVAQLGGGAVLGVQDPDGHTTPRDLFWHNLWLSHAHVFSLAGRGRERLSVLDWGGSIGYLHLLASSTLPGVELDYHVRDQPELCAVGRELLPQVTFHDDDTWSQRTYDLVVASGSIQYAREWESHVQRLARAATSHLHLTRVPVVFHVDSYVVLQRAAEYDTEFVGWAMNRKALISAVGHAGMELVREFVVRESPHVHGAQEHFETRGFLFVPRAGQ